MPSAGLITNGNSGAAMSWWIGLSRLALTSAVQDRERFTGRFSRQEVPVSFGYYNRTDRFAVAVARKAHLRRIGFVIHGYEKD